MKTTLALLAATVATSAAAHIVLEPKSADAGSYFKGTFMVGHGCKGSPTVAVTVTFPADVPTVRPAPKPGWTLDVVRDKERVSKVTWKGRLDADHYDEFIALMRLPDAPGKRKFAILQVCESETMEWSPELEVKPKK